MHDYFSDLLRLPLKPEAVRERLILDPIFCIYVQRKHSDDIVRIFRCNFFKLGTRTICYRQFLPRMSRPFSYYLVPALQRHQTRSSDDWMEAECTYGSLSLDAEALPSFGMAVRTYATKRAKSNEEEIKILVFWIPKLWSFPWRYRNEVRRGVSMRRFFS